MIGRSADASGDDHVHAAPMVGPSDSREPVRVLVVDADRRVRQGLAGLIRVSDGLQLDGATGDPAVAVRTLEAGRPQVVLIDPRLPEAEVGLALLHEIRRRWPEVRIVALSGVRDDRVAPDDAPAVVFVSPTAPPEILVDALRGIQPTTPAGGPVGSTAVGDPDRTPIHGTMMPTSRGPDA